MKKTTILAVIIISLVCFSFAQTPPPEAADMNSSGMPMTLEEAIMADRAIVNPPPEPVDPADNTTIATDNTTATDNAIATIDNSTPIPEILADDLARMNEIPPPKQAFSLNGETIPLPARFHTNSKNFNLALTPVIGEPLQLHFQKRLDGWAINDNIVGYTFDTLALAVDFTDGKAYMLAEDAVRLALGNIPDENIITVSGVSVSKGDMQVILVDAETLRAADINKDFALTLPAPDKPKISDGSIIAAAAKGDAASIRRLLDAGHDINEIEPATGDNALFKAIKRGDEPLADLLIKAGITAGYANAAQQTALQLAAGRAQYRTARALLQAGASANGADILGNTPLLYAIQSGDTDVLELLLKAGAMANVNDGRGRSALALAVELGNMPQVELLLKHGSRDADNAMSTALRTGDASMVERLLAAGASVNRVDSVGNSLLHTAIFNGDNAIAQQLLANGANIDTQNVEGQTPLMFAVMQHNEDVAKALLARGANIYLTDKAGHSVMDIAAATDWDAVHMLEDGIRASQGLEQQFFDKVALGDYAAVRAFLDMEGAWTESENPITGNTALFLAVANNDKDMAYLLLARGADANRQNRKGNTPLMMAVQGADESLFDMLLEAGAQPDMQNASGDTALIVAAKLGRLNIARKLLLANADPNLRNFNGARPLAVAQGENARDVEQMLRSFGAY